MDENLTNFLERVQNDEALRERLLAGENLSAEEALARFQAVAAEEGVAVSAADIQELSAAGKESEIDDEALEKVVGGFAGGFKDAEEKAKYREEALLIKKHWTILSHLFLKPQHNAALMPDR